LTNAAPSLDLKHQHISRQLDLVPIDILDTPITIVGAGAIGSWTALGLAKSGFKKLAVFDHDDVDIVNMSSQFYGVSDIGKPKAHALADRIHEMTGESITAIPEKWQGMKMRGIVVMAVDSMAVRKAIYEAHKGSLNTPWLIDARMGAEVALLYTINPASSKDCEDYEKTLYSDAEAVQEKCTAKSTTYCAIVQSGLVVKTVRDVLVRGKYLRNMNFSLKESDWISFTNDLRSAVK
jgi:Dinucleotide-utilizing enzymes involved in molybdopterin and thiamine biosynthesis family 2